MSTIETTTTIDNGVVIEALNTARTAFAEAPAAASFTWKATSDWVSGTHTRSAANGFFGMGEEQVRSNGGHTVVTDHPEHFSATDAGVTPAELILMGLAGCLSAGVATVATNRGIQLRSVSATVEGDMDMRGIMGVDPDARNGFGEIRVRFTIDADATAEEIQALVAQSQKRSAVADALANPTVLSVEVS